MQEPLHEKRFVAAELFLSTTLSWLGSKLARAFVYFHSPLPPRLSRLIRKNEESKASR